jgi:N2,N2-dimethylguanosine tRNA methyltransferase
MDTQYKCPNCGGKVEFSANSGNMKCPFCDSEFDIEAIKALQDALGKESESKLEWESASSDFTADETTGLGVYHCSSCGGEVVGDENTGATSCPFCGNAIVLTGQFSGGLKPDVVIPFKLDKAAAIKGLENHLKGKRLLPKIFKDQNRIEEIKGIYVPYWLFDADADGYARFKAENHRTWSDSSYIYHETTHYSVVRSGDIGFDHVPVDGSSKMPDIIMESIEPFNYSEAVDFETAYLSGFLADKYDVDSAHCQPRANERIVQSTVDALRNTVTGYQTVRLESKTVNLHGGKVRYALYPVWMLNTTWNDKKFTFAMNGQTGKFVGDLPCDWGLFWKWFFAIAGIASLAAVAVLFLLRLLEII